jgi:archaellum biogenesis protein FlaJ (TadC family)
MPAMARNIKSDLVQRYATIIGETSRIGGDPAIVIHRAAKDMDDFIKLNKERRRQLTTQASIVYIAVAVLLIVLYQLVIMFPSIGTIDFGLMGQTNVEDIKGTAIARMSFIEVKRQFFDLCLINAVGTGTVIGSLIDGHFKYGLIHSLILTAVSAVFFIVLIL